MSGGSTGMPRSRHSPDRKSTLLNSSHLGISYAVACLKKKNPREPISVRPPTEGCARRGPGRRQGPQERRSPPPGEHREVAAARGELADRLAAIVGAHT